VTANKTRSSRIARFYELPIAARIANVAEAADLGDASRLYLERGGGLPVEVADTMSENVLASFGLPFSVALNFTVDGRDVLVPMAVEEPSVVAAASNAARMVRGSGGFVGEADAPVMTAQIQLDEVPEPAKAAERVAAHREALLAAGDAVIPRMVARGGGCRDLDTRVVDAESGLVVVQVHVDVGDAMGANLVDTVAEALAGPVQELIGGRIGLRILTNLTLRRRVRVRARVSAADLGERGEELAAGIARASRFAELDVARAVTHNKGFMNGVDAVAVALGQDFRSIEAGAHAYAALGGVTGRAGYQPLSVWRQVEGGLEGRAELPMAVGTVGGSCRAHAGVRAGFELLGLERAGELAVVMASVGLASNLAALKALAGEGIQKGHMRLHRRKHEEEPR
jgi:hydroxymethylglutaryl-CoA reductase